MGLTLTLLLGLAACTSTGGLHLPTAEVLTITPGQGPSGGGVSVTLAGAGFVQPRDVSAGALSVEVCGVPLRDVRVGGDVYQVIMPGPAGVMATVGDSVTGVTGPGGTVGVSDVVITTADGQRVVLAGAFECLEEVPVEEPTEGPIVEEFQVTEVGLVGEETRFAWSVRHSVEGEALTCSLDPGDGSEPHEVADCLTTTSLAHTYQRDGEVTARLLVADVDGVTAEATASLTVTGADRWLELTIDTSLVGSSTFVLPLYGSGHVTIEWGDGFVEDVTDPAGPSHVFAADGVYSIRVAGALASGARYGRGAVRSDSARMVTSLDAWGNLNITDLTGAFYYAQNLTSVPSYLPVGVTVARHMFGESGFNGDISTWDTSNATDMSWMFAESGFNGDISNWNTSNATNMSHMFAESNFNGDISAWDTSNVTKMNAMFYASSFNGDISTWNTSNATDMNGMFFESSFNGDISAWNTSNVTNMSWMFAESDFNRDISTWNTSNVTDMYGMFRNARSFNQDLHTWCVAHIPSEPDRFSLGADNWTERKPNWGAPCTQ